MADLIVRCEGVNCVLCAAGVQGDVLLSARAETADAADLLRQTLAGKGHGGGHRERAGGRIPGEVTNGAVATSMGDTLRRQWLQACGVVRGRGTRLVPKREIFENLG